MNFNTYAINTLRTLGERIDSKKCFEARDDHFICLDQFNDREGISAFKTNFVNDNRESLQV